MCDRGRRNNDDPGRAPWRPAMGTAPQAAPMSGAEEAVENGAVHHNCRDDRDDGFPARRPARRPRRRRRPESHRRHVQARGDLLALSFGHRRSDAHQMPGHIDAPSLSARVSLLFEVFARANSLPLSSSSPCAYSANALMISRAMPFSTPLPSKLSTHSGRYSFGSLGIGTCTAT